MSNGLTKNYLDHIQAHVDEGGTISHRNGVDLLAEVHRLRKVLDDEDEEGDACHGPQDTTCASCGLGGSPS
jgi:hypothetical protein